jgi:hypothetical protein
MWRALMDWLPDLKVGTVEIRDVVGLVVATLSVFLAYLAIKLGREQAKTASEQTAIAKRQSEIAETQHRIMLDQLSQRPVLEMRVVNASQGNDGLETFAIDVFNSGSKPAKDIFWHLNVDSALAKKLVFEWSAPIERVNEGTEGGRSFVHFRGFRPKPLYPQRYSVLCTVTVSAAVENYGEVRWQVVSEGGRFPENEKYGLLYFERPSEDDG